MSAPPRASVSPDLPVRRMNVPTGELAAAVQGHPRHDLLQIQRARAATDPFPASPAAESSGSGRSGELSKCGRRPLFPASSESVRSVRIRSTTSRSSTSRIACFMDSFFFQAGSQEWKSKNMVKILLVTNMQIRTLPSQNACRVTTDGMGPCYH